MHPRNMFRDSRLIVHILVCLFGIASWIDINGLWVELPLMVTKLPEAWSLPSYMIVIIQVANIGPLLFVILSYMNKGKRLEVGTSILIISVGLVSCILLAIFWQETTIIAGKYHSTALLTLNFFLATVDCTSSLAFLAFMASLKAQYLSTYFIGEGLSGMIPSLAALGQGAGQINCINGSNINATMVNNTWFNATSYFTYPMYEEPKFSVQVFFFILSAMMLLSLTSFLVLKYHPSLKSEYTKNFTSLDKYTEKPVEVVTITKFETQNGEKKHKSVKQEMDRELKSTNAAPTTTTIVILLFTVAWINFFTSSFLLAIQTYSCLPYDIEVYHLTVTLTNIANPLACFAAMFYTIYSTVGIAIITCFGTALGSYIIVAAAMSPSPPLVHHASGGPIMVTTWVLCIFVLTYAKVGVANVLRLSGRKSLILCGAFTQIGSFIGAIVGYIVVNIYALFVDAPYC
ncbi:hypothetical protein SNE40_010937 [Patella caerulea]|uniref:Riboflavin transporter n=2 Tax=Patella caerulea TaxID=87958 RepID=A0AAN8K1Z3_PATCE